MAAEYTAGFTVSAGLAGCDESMMVEQSVSAAAALYCAKSDSRLQRSPNVALAAGCMIIIRLSFSLYPR